jgi:hypothetical protein
MLFRHSLFDFLAFRHHERLHIQMLMWLLSPESNVLDHTQKISLFNHLSGLNASRGDDIRFIKRYEKKRSNQINQDIVLRVGENVCVLENRIRFPHYTERIEEYRAVLDPNSDSIFRHSEELRSAKQLAYSYLTLCEFPQFGEGWRVVRYTELLTLLQLFAYQNALPSLSQTPHETMYIEYLSALGQFVASAHTFLTEAQCRCKAVSLTYTLHTTDEYSRYGVLSPLQIPLQSATAYCVAQSLFPLLTITFWFDIWSQMKAEYPALKMYVSQFGEFVPACMNLVWETVSGTDKDGMLEYGCQYAVRFNHTIVEVGISQQFQARPATHSWIPQSVSDWFDEHCKRLGYEKVEHPSRRKSMLVMVRDVRAETGVKHSLLELPNDELISVIRKEIFRADAVVAELRCMPLGTP